MVINVVGANLVTAGWAVSKKWGHSVAEIGGKVSEFSLVSPLGAKRLPMRSIRGARLWCADFIVVSQTRNFQLTCPGYILIIEVHAPDTEQRLLQKLRLRFSKTIRLVLAKWLPFGVGKAIVGVATHHHAEPDPGSKCLATPLADLALPGLTGSHAKDSHTPNLKTSSLFFRNTLHYRHNNNDGDRFWWSFWPQYTAVAGFLFFTSE